ncbi:MAG: type II toxin-antitoxin system VapC family toxin [Cyclobacteriaceae bacterium]
MRNILVDAGPLIALFDSGDQYHLKALRFVEEFKGTFWTTWPVVTEVSHMLDFNTTTQANFLKWIGRGGLKPIDLDDHHVQRVIALSEKFNDVPMDLADASLVAVSETTNYNEIASIDSDFYIYRDLRNKYLTNIFL